MLSLTEAAHMTVWDSMRRLLLTIHMPWTWTALQLTQSSPLVSSSSAAVLQSHPLLMLASQQLAGTTGFDDIEQ